MSEVEKTSQANLTPVAQSQRVTVAVVHCETKVPPAKEIGLTLGTCPYYRGRYNNFLKRHKTCVHKTPPDYYLNYGEKYCIRFSTELAPKLSKDGQSWLKKARLNLQVAMELGLQEKPWLELDNDAFRKFAFDTHPDAYWDAGLEALPCSDICKILITPDPGDLLGSEGRSQAWEISSRMPAKVAKCAPLCAAYIAGATSVAAVNKTVEGAQAAGAAIGQAATQVGQTATEVATDIKEYFQNLW